MTPAARVAAAIEILDRVLAGDPAEPTLIRWARSSRFAGSGDRAAVRDLVYDTLRRLRSRAALGGGMTGRALMLGMCREAGLDAETVFSGEGHAPTPLDAAERGAGQPPAGAELLDLPDWLLPRWRDSLGEHADEIALMMRERAPVWLRVNLARTEPAAVGAMLAEAGIATLPSADLPSALVVTDGVRKLASSLPYQQGLVELQDLSAQMACAALPITGSVLDYCAGGGGKALAMAALGAGAITAHDIDPARMSDLPDRAARAGAKIELAEPGALSGTFELVIADVPCSGSGTWRRTPDQKWRLTEERLASLVTLQASIVDKAASFVGRGGYLAYMTCSVISDENEDQVGAFLARSPAFQMVTSRHFTPLEASDGFYMALFRRD